MRARRIAALLGATLICAGAPAWAQAQGTFGAPFVVDEGGKEPDDFGLTAPTKAQLFRVQSELELKQRLRQELPKVKMVDFPRDTPLPKTALEAAPLLNRVVAPAGGQVCYRPLYFEDKPTERFGQYVPCVQPLLSAERFYRDFLLLPCRMWLTPPWTFECDNR